MAFTDPTTGAVINQIKKPSYTHDGMIDLILANPAISQGAIASYFGYSQSWISIILNSDAFRERLAARKSEIVDPILMSTMDDRLRALCDKSIEVLLEKLEAGRNPNVAVRVLEHSSRALGYGAQLARQPVQVNTYVALLPAKSASPEAWITQHTPTVEVIENAPAK